MMPKYVTKTSIHNGVTFWILHDYVATSTNRWIYPVGTQAIKTLQTEVLALLHYDKKRGLQMLF